MNLTGQKDADLLILKELDDRSLFNYCKAGELNKYISKLCKDENFWRNRFIKKFGISSKPKQSWRKLYLSIVYYLDDNNIENFIGLNEALFIATRENNMDAIQFFISKGANEFNIALKNAATIGNKELIDFYISKGARDWNHGLFGATENGNLELINFFIDKGAEDFDTGMEIAAERKDMDLINFFIEKGANNWNNALLGAARGGDLEIVKFFINKGATDVDWGSHEAGYYGHRNIVDYFLSINPNSLYALDGAVRGGHKELVEYLENL